MTISAETAKLIYNAITYTTAQAYMNLLDHDITLDENGNPTEATIQCIQDTAKQMMIDFCEEADIDKVELDDDEDISTDRNDKDMINNEYYGDSQWCESHGYPYTVKNGIFYWQTNYQTGERGLDKEIHWHEHDYFDRVINDDEDYDIPDDVDETNYDPFLGQDFYE